MLGHTILLIFIILAVLIIFSTPTPLEVSTAIPQGKTYVDMAELIVDASKINYEVRLVKDAVPRPRAGALLGSSTGHLVHALNAKGVYTTGVDESLSMVKRSRELFSDTFIHGEYTSALLFQEHSLTHVLCLNYTLWFIPDKQRLFRSVHQWLEPGGLFIVHVPVEWKSPLHPKYTSTLVHNTLRETVTLDKVYKLSRPVYRESQASIVQLAISTGFEVDHEMTLPFPYSDQVIILKSVDPVYL